MRSSWCVRNWPSTSIGPACRKTAANFSCESARQSTRVIYLSDNDIVEKLAVCDLLDDTLVAFQTTRTDVYVIPTLRYRIGGRARGKAEKRLGRVAVARILEFLEDAHEIRDYSPEDHELLD